MLSNQAALDFYNYVVKHPNMCYDSWIVLCLVNSIINLKVEYEYLDDFRENINEIKKEE